MILEKKIFNKKDSKHYWTSPWQRQQFISILFNMYYQWHNICQVAVSSVKIFDTVYKDCRFCKIDPFEGLNMYMQFWI